jgi:hypothetical protein
MFITVFSKPTAGPYPGPHESSPLPPSSLFFKTHFNIILLYTLTSPKLQTCLQVSLLTFSLHVKQARSADIFLLGTYSPPVWLYLTPDSCHEQYWGSVDTRVYRHWSGRARTFWTVVAWHKWIRVVWRHASWMVDQTTWPHMFTRRALVPYPGCKITLQTEGRTVVPLMTSCPGRRRMRNQRLRPFYYV